MGGSPPGQEEALVGPPKVYIVFWGSQWGTESTNGTYDTFSGDPLGVAPYLQAFFSGLGTNSEKWSTILTQYCGSVPAGTTTCPSTAPHIQYPTSPVLAGVWYDTTDPYPMGPSLLTPNAPPGPTDGQLMHEAEAAAVHFGNLTTSSNASAQYFIVSPTGTHPNGFPSNGFCAWHSTDGNGIYFTNMPYVPDAGESCGANEVNQTPSGALDGVSIVAGHEYAETMTDPSAGGGWMNDGSYAQEIGDLCVGQDMANLSLSTGNFAVQGLWSNSANGCDNGIPKPNLYTMSASGGSGGHFPGDTMTETISTTVTSGVPIPISLTASGQPPGSVVTFSPAQFSSGQSSLVTIQTSPTTPPGVYTIVVTGTPTGTTANTVNFALIIVPRNIYTISSLSPAYVATPGSTLSVQMGVNTISGDTPVANVTTSPLPPGVTLEPFFPDQMLTTVTPVLFNIASNAPEGAYSITLSSTNGEVTPTTTFTVFITAPPVWTATLPLQVTAQVGTTVNVPLSTPITSGIPLPDTIAFTNVPPGVSVVSASSGTTGQTVNVAVSTSSSVSPGVYPIKVDVSTPDGLQIPTFYLHVEPDTPLFSAKTVNPHPVITTPPMKKNYVTISTAVTQGDPLPVVVRVLNAPHRIVVKPTSRVFMSGRRVGLRVTVLRGVKRGVYHFTVTLRSSTHAVGMKFAVRVN
jgi:serine protease